jgi:hypothetical protein
MRRTHRTGTTFTARSPTSTAGTFGDHHAQRRAGRHGHERVVARGQHRRWLSGSCRRSRPRKKATVVSPKTPSRPRAGRPCHVASLVGHQHPRRHGEEGQPQHPAHPGRVRPAA